MQYDRSLLLQKYRVHTLRATADPRPHDLLSRNCIRDRLPSVGLLPWRFARNGKSFEVAVDGALVVNDVPLALSAARDGLGLLQTHSNRVESFIAQGELETVLDDWAPLRQIDFAISLKLFRTRVPAPTPRTPYRRNSHRTNAKRPVTRRPAQHSAECASTA